jgi:hypothetical protein
VGEKEMSVKKRAVVFVWVLALMASSAYAAISYDFESGLGHNYSPIGSVSGLVFSTTSGGSMRFADINSGWYSATSDNGKTYEDGKFLLSGNVAGCVANTSDQGRIGFAYSSASWLTVGYTSEYEFVMEAYDASGTFLTSATGAANTKAPGVTGLAYLTVSSPGISYVVLHDHGRYWMIDNVTSDASAPEPASCVTLLAGLISMSWRFRRRRV